MRAHPEIRSTSLYLLESGQPGVVLKTVGTALAAHYPGLWSRDTPERILEGSEPPDISQGPTVAADSPDYDLSALMTAIGSAEWFDYLNKQLPEGTYLQIKYLWATNQSLISRVRTLERLLAEREIPQGQL